MIKTIIPNKVKGPSKSIIRPPAKTGPLSMSGVKQQLENMEATGKSMTVLPVSLDTSSNLAANEPSTWRTVISSTKSRTPISSANLVEKTGNINAQSSTTLKAGEQTTKKHFARPMSVAVFMEDKARRRGNNICSDISMFSEFKLATTPEVSAIQQQPTKILDGTVDRRTYTISHSVQNVSRIGYVGYTAVAIFFIHCRPTWIYVLQRAVLYKGQGLSRKKRLATNSESEVQSPTINTPNLQIDAIETQEIGGGPRTTTIQPEKAMEDGGMNALKISHVCLLLRFETRWQPRPKTAFKLQRQGYNSKWDCYGSFWSKTSSAEGRWKRSWFRRDEKTKRLCSCGHTSCWAPIRSQTTTMGSTTSSSIPSTASRIRSGKSPVECEEI